MLYGCVSVKPGFTLFLSATNNHILVAVKLFSTKNNKYRHTDLASSWCYYFDNMPGHSIIAQRRRRGEPHRRGAAGMNQSCSVWVDTVSQIRLSLISDCEQEIKVISEPS